MLSTCYDGIAGVLLLIMCVCVCFLLLVLIVAMNVVTMAQHFAFASYKMPAKILSKASNHFNYNVRIFDLLMMAG